MNETLFISVPIGLNCEVDVVQERKKNSKKEKNFRVSWNETKKILS